MSYKIVMDSCGELPENLKQDPHFELIPLTLEVGEERIIDDASFNQGDFLAKVAATSECAKSACPSPERFMEAYKSDAENIFVVTLSSHLSGSYNSACVAKLLLEEQGIHKNIYVCDSESACCGETQIAFKLRDLSEEGLSFEEIVEKIEDFRNQMNTYFVLDNLETLRKNGRLSAVKALVASTLNIKPVMGAIKGVIIEKAKTVGTKKALNKMVEICVAEAKETGNKRLMITQCNCPERAEFVKEKILSKAPFMEVHIFEAAGVSSLYANDGGVVVAF